MTSTDPRPAGTPAPAWALVTGSTSGIGRETALLLAEDGHDVIVHGRDPGRAEQTVAAIEKLGRRARAVLADLAVPDGAAHLAARALEIGGDALDVLVNNAGGGSFAPTAQVTDQQFDAQFTQHVRAPFVLVRALAPAMAARGHGIVVNVGALSSTMAAAGAGAFQASKAALELLTRTWTAEFGAQGVRVNSVCPGYFRTAATEPYTALYDGFVSQLPARRGGQAREAAEVIRFLVSPRSSYVHGASVPVDGGRSAVIVL